MSGVGSEISGVGIESRWVRFWFGEIVPKPKVPRNQVRFWAGGKMPIKQMGIGVVGGTLGGGGLWVMG